MENAKANLYFIMLIPIAMFAQARYSANIFSLIADYFSSSSLAFKLFLLIIHYEKYILYNNSAHTHTHTHIHTNSHLMPGSTSISISLSILISTSI